MAERGTFLARRGRGSLFFAALLLTLALSARANPPVAKYIFPAGGQRGTTVHAKVGGCFFHDEANFEMLGPGVRAPAKVREVPTIWFEGPLIPQPASQQPEDYPRDHACDVQIAADAPLGLRAWRAWTSQGVTPAARFVVGDLPEVVEEEVGGTPVPVKVQMPVTINGRIFPREDVDVWTFDAKAGQAITCDVDAKRLGSPLEAELKVLDPAGRPVRTRTVRVGGDPRVHFVAESAGVYQVRIHDIAFSGLQNYVYRLTISADPYVDAIYPLGGRRGTGVAFQLAGHALKSDTATLQLPATGDEAVVRIEQGGRNSNVVVLELGDVAEVLEAEPNNRASEVKPVETPATLNGRIDHPGDVDYWAVSAKKDQVFDLELWAGRLGSLMDSVLTVEDAAGKQLARNDDVAAGQSDSQLSFKAPADGVYYIRVEDRFPSRGGAAFGYRLRVTPATPDFRLSVALDSIGLFRDVERVFGPQEKKAPPPASALLKVDLQRLGGFDGPVKLALEGLPEGVTAEGTTIAAKQVTTQVKLTAAPDTKITTARVRLRGSAHVAGKKLDRFAALPSVPGLSMGNELMLAVAMPTPFKATGEFAAPFVPCGSVYRRPFKIDWGGFDGPLYVRLADRQIRHLQRVTGPTLTIPPGTETFEYPVTLGAEMELGRTSRSIIMLWGQTKDKEGNKHTVSYSSGDPIDQCVAIATASLLGVRPERASVQMAPGTVQDFHVGVQRAQSLAGQPVTLDFVPQGPARGTWADPIVIPADQNTGTLRIHFGPDPGSEIIPVKIRATVPGPHDPSVAEAPVDLVPPPKESAK